MGCGALLVRVPEEEPVEPAPAAAPAGCPECGATLLRTNGCVLCARCGYSPCE